jgi:hypothetical protein
MASKTTTRQAKNPTSKKCLAASAAQPTTRTRSAAAKQPTAKQAGKRPNDYSNLSSVDVLVWLRGSKRRAAAFTTQQVAEHFSISRGRAAAFVAVLSRKGSVRRAGDLGYAALHPFSLEC